MTTQPRPKVVPPRARSRNGSLWAVWCGVAGLCLLILIVPYFLFVESPPPRRIVIATGGPAGAYYGFGRQYAELLKKDGITLEVLETEGSVDNLRLLTDEQYAAGYPRLAKLGTSRVDVAILQSGVAGPEDGKRLEALGSLYREPLWIFYRGDKPLHLVSELAGKRLSIGPEGSGTRVAALEILKANDVAPPAGGDKLGELKSKDAAEALKKGEVDAAFFVAAVEASYVKDLLAADGIRLMSLTQHEAYQRRYRHLSGVVVPAGLVDLGKNIPAEDTHLIGPTAMLVVRKDFHPELVWLLLAAATKVHGKPTLLTQPGEFPSGALVDLPLQEDATTYYKSGPPMLHRIMPFWAASQVDRLKIMIIPVVMLLMPLVRLAPPLVRWRTRRKIYLWYNSLRDIDEKLIAGISMQDLKHELARLREIEEQVAAVDVPLSYMEEFYNMRFHLQMVRNKLEKLLAEKGEPVTT